MHRGEKIQGRYVPLFEQSSTFLRFAPVRAAGTLRENGFFSGFQSSGLQKGNVPIQGVWWFFANAAKILDRRRELGISHMWIGLCPATVRRYLGHNSQIGTPSIQTPAVTRGRSEDNQRRPPAAAQKARATARTGSRRVCSVVPRTPGATWKVEEASLLSFRDRGDDGSRGRKTALGNSLAIERTAGLGCPSHWSPGQRCSALGPDPERIRAIAQRSARSGV